MTTRAGNLVYARVESGRDGAREEICGPTDHISSSFEMATVVEGLSVLEQIELPAVQHQYVFIHGYN